MEPANLDRIHIKDLLLRCIVGIYEEERRDKQDVIINITLYADLRRAGQSDNIQDSVDYKAVKKKVVALVQQSSFLLVEALAESIAKVCLESPAVKRARVQVEKPGALRFARTVGVEIFRERKDIA